jgi:hypothetical protein
MIHTLQFSSVPIFDDIELIKNNFEVTKINNQLVYYKQYRALSFTYYSFFNSLHIKVNLNKLINKDIIIDADYSEVIKQYKEQFFEVGFKYTDPLLKLNRVDYKADIITPYKDTYIKLLKKGSANYSALKQYTKYKTSVYYSSKSQNINIYDKLQELIDTDRASLVDISKYENMLRFEVQLKRNKLYYLEKSEGICRDLINYFNHVDHDYFINKSLNKIIYDGDYYNLYHSQKILKENFTKSMTDKLIEMQKDISINGVSEAKAHYNNSTFNNYIKAIEGVGVNPIVIPKNEEITYLKNLFSFTSNNIYLLNDYKLVA